MAARTSNRATVFLWTVLLTIPLAGFELFSFTLIELRPDLFDRRETFLSQLLPGDFERFKQQAASDMLGWDNLAGRTRRQLNCIGTE